MRAAAPAEPVPAETAEAAAAAEVSAPRLLVAAEVAEAAPEPAPEPAAEGAPPPDAALEATEAAPTGAAPEATNAAPPATDAAPQGTGAAQQAAMLAAGVKVPAQGQRYTWAHGGHLSAYFSPLHTLPQYTPDANEPHCCYREVAS